MISVLGITGVPWQNLVTEESLENEQVMELLTPEELNSSGAWLRILGDPENRLPPSDPHLIVSPLPREGLSSASDPFDPVHGHEVTRTINDDLQASCIFELPAPRRCVEDEFCACPPGTDVLSPLCRAEDGTYTDVQRFAPALPAPRMLEFLRSLGSRAQPASICPRQLDDPQKPGYGYTDALKTVEALDQTTWDMSCFTPSLPLAKDGSLNCKLLELHEGKVDCDALGRTTASGVFAEAFLRTLKVTTRKTATPTTVCELPRLSGDVHDPSSPAFACANELIPDLSGEVGYCYIDEALEIGNPALVEFCEPSFNRRVRLMPPGLPLPGTRTSLICDYGEE